jgi:Lon protease-like protein
VSDSLCNAEDLPTQVGVMVLPGVTLFPGSLLPLYIFEPRYRLMLAQALESGRMFAVANADEDRGEVFAVAGVGLVRACVQNEDGTSHLVLQGLSRVRFTRWVQKEPFFIGEMEALSSVPLLAEEVGEAMAEIRHLCCALRSRGLALPERFEEHLNQIEDPAVFSDILAATLIAEPEQRQLLLEELNVECRLELLTQSLQDIVGSP